MRTFLEWRCHFGKPLIAIIQIMIIIFFLSCLSCVKNTSNRMPKEQQIGSMIDGKIDKDGVINTIKEHLLDISHCHKKHILENEDMSGRAIIEWTINNMGEVDNAEILKSHDKARKVAECIKEIIHQWKFPKPYDDNKVIVRYPFVFK